MLDFLYFGEDFALRGGQLVAVEKALSAGGLVGHLGVGSGKTLLLQLLGTLLPSERPLLILPAHLRNATQRLSREYQQHWLLRDIPISSYEALSSPKGGRLLAGQNPDLLLLDEAHYLRHASSTRARRIARYLHDHPQTKVVAVSGTLLGKDPTQYAHLLRWALKAASPLSRRSLADCRDLRDLFQGGANLRGMTTWKGLSDFDAFDAWLAGQVGVVVDRGASCGATLVVRTVTLPGAPVAEIKEWNETWELRGRICCDALQHAEVLRQLHCGIFYRWVERPSAEWELARRKWGSAVRRYLPRSGPERDSPSLLVRACAQGQAPTEYLKEAWDQWEPHHRTPPPDTEPVMVSTSRLRAIEQWALAQGDCLVWWPWRPALLDLAPMRLIGLGGGPKFEAGPRVLGRGYAEGHNLQAWSKNFVVVPPSSGAAWEQLLGRTHRAGQESDEVTVDILSDTHIAEEGLSRAREEGSSLLDAATWL